MPMHIHLVRNKLGVYVDFGGTEVRYKVVPLPGHRGLLNSFSYLGLKIFVSQLTLTAACRVCAYMIRTFIGCHGSAYLCSPFAPDVFLRWHCRSYNDKKAD